MCVSCDGFDTLSRVYPAMMPEIPVDRSDKQAIKLNSLFYMACSCLVRPCRKLCANEF